MDPREVVPIVHRAHLELVSPLRGSLWALAPVYAVRKALTDSLQHSDLTGFEVRDLLLDPPPGRRDMPLPELRWLWISGYDYRHDFCLDHRLDLVVSDRALELLRSHSLAGCEVAPVSPPS